MMNRRFLVERVALSMCLLQFQPLWHYFRHHSMLVQDFEAYRQSLLLRLTSCCQSRHIQSQDQCKSAAVNSRQAKNMQVFKQSQNTSCLNMRMKSLTSQKRNQLIGNLWRYYQVQKVLPILTSLPLNIIIIQHINWGFGVLGASNNSSKLI